MQITQINNLLPLLIFNNLMLAKQRQFYSCSFSYCCHTIHCLATSHLSVYSFIYLLSFLISLYKVTSRLSQLCVGTYIVHINFMLPCLPTISSTSLHDLARQHLDTSKTQHLLLLSHLPLQNMKFIIPCEEKPTTQLSFFHCKILFL